MTTSHRKDRTTSLHPLRSLLPGLALVGFTIGTGSVTSMVKAGADYGMELLWALVLSCVITYFLFESFGRLTLVTGKTMLRAVWEHIHPAVALFICIALTVNVCGSIMGVMGIVADVLSEWSGSLTTNPIPSVVFAGVLSLFIFGFLVLGDPKSFQNVLALLAGVMGVCFLLNALRMLPDINAVASGLIPHVPSSPGATHANGFLVTASMVGTTVAPIVLVFRSIMLREEAWTVAQLATQRRDARVSAGLIFIVSAAIMASAAATLHVNGIRLNHAREMIPILEPIAGRLAVIVFVVGITAAGISSQFPNVVSPVFFISDLRGQSVRTRGSWAIACLFVAASVGLVVPLFKARPVLIMLASQALGAVLLPVTVACILYLLNCPSLIGAYRNMAKDNVVLSLILVFAIAMGLIGVAGLLA